MSGTRTGDGTHHRPDAAKARSRRGPHVARELAPGVYCLGPWGWTSTVVYFVRSPQPGRAGSSTPSWVLVDAGWPGDGARIRRAAERVFGTAPAAILLTHEHPDHEGDALQLARSWGCPVYVSTAELPVAVRDFPAMKASAMPLDRWLVLPILQAMGRRRREGLFERASLVPVVVGLTPGDPIPVLPGWECLATPGHTRGHVSFFRPADRVLLSGDALVTTKIDTVRGLLLRRQGLSGPPWYTTWDRDQARASLRLLAGLRPAVLAGGHGEPLTGPETAEQVARFAEACDADGRTIVSRATIPHPPERVFAFLADLRQEPQWNDKLLEVVPLTDGPLREGSRFRARFAGPVGDSVITYAEVDPPRRWRTSSSSRRLDVRFTGTITGTDGGSEVTLRTTLLPRGALRLLRPVLGAIMARQWEHHLTIVAERLANAGATPSAE